MAGRISRLQFPLGGLDRKRSYRDQPPFTSADLQNVRGFSTFEQRDRGGSRPGLIKSFQELVGSGTDSVRLLEDLDVVSSEEFTVFQDDFTSPTLGAGWTAATWLTTPANAIILPGSLVGVEWEVKNGHTSGLTE